MGSAWRARYGGLIYALLTAVLVTLLYAFTGLFRYADGLAYDTMMRLTAGRHQVSNMLLVEAGFAHREDGDATWLEMVKTLENLGAARVVFTFVPEHVSADFYAYARKKGNIIFGRRMISSPSDPEAMELEPWPEKAGGDLPYGVVVMPVAEYGVYRWQRTHVRAEGALHPTLEAAAAALSSRFKHAEMPEIFLINYEMGAGQFPRMSLERVLKGGAIRELVAGRTILIGLSGTSEIPGVQTPVSLPGFLTPLLEVRGAAIYTLLSGRIVRQMGPVLLFACLLALMFVSLVLYHWLDIRRATLASAVVFVLYLAAVWYAFVSLLLWIPVVALVSGQVLYFILFFREKALAHEQTMREMLEDLASELKKRVVPASFYETREHWAQVANMIYQTLDLERLILLERVEGDHRVREVHALNCSLEDIGERRRDYEREPYKTAIAENGPIQLTRPYLRNRRENEQEYLVPLVFGGEVLGFWAFTVLPEHKVLIHNFPHVIRDFAHQISELLYHRQRWQAEHRQEEEPGLQGYLGVEGHDRILREVHKDLALLEFRLASLENVLNGMSVASIVYDLFGDVLQVNRRMEDLAKQLDIEPYELTALDFIHELTDIGAERCRQMFREVVLEHGRFSLPVHSEKSERVFMLSLQPLYHRESEQAVESGEAHPFALQGILCELIDVTEMRSHYGVKDRLIERFLFRMRNDLQGVLTGSALLTHSELDGDQRSRTEALMARKIDHVVDMFARTHEYISKDLETGTSEVYPVDPRQAVVQAAHALQSQARRHKVALQLNLPRFASLVLADHSGMLDWAVRTSMSILLEDAVENSTLVVDMEESDRWLTIRCKNQGFGLPEARLKDYLFGDMPVESRLYRNMREAILRIREWGGDVHARSQVGEGMQIELKLEVFFHD